MREKTYLGGCGRGIDGKVVWLSNILRDDLDVSADTCGDIFSTVVVCE